MYWKEAGLECLPIVRGTSGSKAIFLLLTRFKASQSFRGFAVQAFEKKFD
jgi:hypothetical protein